MNQVHPKCSGSNHINPLVVPHLDTVKHHEHRQRTQKCEHRPPLIEFHIPSGSNRHLRPEQYQRDAGQIPQQRKQDAEAQIVPAFEPGIQAVQPDIRRHAVQRNEPHKRIHQIILRRKRRYDTPHDDQQHKEFLENAPIHPPEKHIQKRMEQIQLKIRTRKPPPVRRNRAQRADHFFP